MRQRDEAGSHDDGDGRPRVVVLSDEEIDQHRRCTRDPDWSKSRITEERDEAGDPQRRQQDQEEEEVDKEIGDPSTGLDVSLVIGDINDGGKSVGDLPHDVRRPDDQHEDAADPRVLGPKILSQ